MIKTSFSTQDRVIATHHVFDYGATADDKSDDSAAFQEAIDACSRDGGGVLFVPGGKYMFRRRLELKAGVTIRGEWQPPGKVSRLPETLLCVYYGKNKPAVRPFVSLGASSGLKDLSIWYPEQSFSSPVPYAWTIQQESGISAGLENITIYNAWQGIQAGPRHNQLLTVKNLFMTVLHTGFLRDSVYDCQKLQKIRFSPRYWEGSGLSGAPNTPAEKRQLRDYLLKEATGVVLTHYDWTWMYDWLVEGFHTGVRTQRSTVKTESRGPNGGFVKLELVDNYIGMEIDDINRCGWADTDLLIRSKVKDCIGIKVAKSLKSAAQFLNVTFEGNFKYCVFSEASVGCVLMSGCKFKSWAADGYAVYASSGVLELLQNSFEQEGNHIFLGKRMTSAVLLGNQFAGTPAITNTSWKKAKVVIDHTDQKLKMCDLSEFEYPEAIYKPKKSALYNVHDFGAKGDGKTDNYAAFMKALKKAYKNGGGTVYVPAGKYVLKKGIVIPDGTELRGVFDNCHHTMDRFVKGDTAGDHGVKGTELFALCGKGNEKEKAFIRLRSGASIRGVTIFYPEQTWADYKKNKVFTPFPWTIQSLGPNTRVKDVVLVNSYKGADFGTYESTGHSIDYLCGTVLKTGLYVDNCLGKGYIKNVQWNPSFWAWSAYPKRPENSSCDLLRDAVKNVLTSFVFGYSKQENTLHTFSFGSKVGIEFIKNAKRGGVNGNFVAHGIDHCGISMIFNDVGKNAKFVNFQIVSMDVDIPRRFLEIRDRVKGRAEFYNLLGWGHDPCAEIGIEMKSGDFYFLLTSLASFGLEYGIKQTGGSLLAAGFRFGEGVKSKIAGGHVSGLYGYFGDKVKKTDLIGAIKRNDVTDDDAYINKGGAKVTIRDSGRHTGF